MAGRRRRTFDHGVVPGRWLPNRLRESNRSHSPGMKTAPALSVQDRQLRLKPSERFARAISWIGHPLVFVTVSVGLVISARLANRTGFIILLTLFFCVILTTAILFIVGYRLGYVLVTIA